MSVLHFNNVTKIGILHVLIRFVFTSIMTLARLRQSKISVYIVDS